MRTTSLLARVTIILVAIMLLIGYLVTSFIAVKWLTPSDNQAVAVETVEVEKIVEVPVEKDVVIDKIVEVPTTTSENDTLVCEFILGYNDRGKSFGPGTVVNGPAVVKPFADKAHAYAIMPGTKYTTTHNKEVVWLYRGDSDCVLANAGPDFFTSYEVVIQ